MNHTPSINYTQKRALLTSLRNQQPKPTFLERFFLSFIYKEAQASVNKTATVATMIYRKKMQLSGTTRVLHICVSFLSSLLENDNR